MELIVDQNLIINQLLYHDLTVKNYVKKVVKVKGSM